MWGVARCCLPRSPGQPQHHKYQNRIWWWWFLLLTWSSTWSCSRMWCVIWRCITTTHGIQYWVKWNQSVIYLQQKRRYMFLPVFVCLFVCLSVCLWARLLKGVHGFGWNVACQQMSGHGRTGKLLSPIPIIVQMPEPDCFLQYRMRCNTEFYYIRKIPPVGIGIQQCVVLQ